MELEIKCHNCGKLHFSNIDFDIWVEDEDIEDEILVYCKRCKRPNQVNYIIENGNLISLSVNDGKSISNLLRLNFAYISVVVTDE